ncbi:MAG: NAD+ synthase [Candidatus Omnitrophica bacterium]|nr:NAD+ synthase [Candidatus Omnitrophota bacterium]
MIRIAAVQMNFTVGDLSGNRHIIEDNIRRAKKKNADIVVFPELAVCGYPPEDLLYKEHFVRDNIRALRSLAKKTAGITAIVGFVDIDRTKKLYNAAAVLCDGKIKGVYRKEALPNYGVFDEKRYFTPGKNNKIFSDGTIKFGVSICEDLWIEKGACQRQAKQGARLLINISASPYEVGKLKERETLLKRRARSAKSFVCYVNLVGGQDELVFDGSSFIISPGGKIVASGKQFEEDLIIADLDIREYERRDRARPVPTKAGKAPPIKPHLSRQLSQDERIYQALVLGTRDYARKNGFKKAVLGLSGGIDSSLVAAIAVDALGKENVIGVTMPSQYTSAETREDAEKLSGNLGIRLIVSPIEKIFSVYLSELKDQLKETEFGIAEENLQARIRGDILMTLSNKFGWLVLTTGNKSEVAVGYCTLYGDMTGGFAVIKDVPKTKVYDLVKLRNLRGNIIPESVLQRAPSAELRLNQKDQDSLPPYGRLDEMIKEYIEKHWSLGQMVRKNDVDLVKKTIRMIDQSEYKRRQAPPGVKITPRAFGKDWRLPITNRYKEG